MSKQCGKVQSTYLGRAVQKGCTVRFQVYSGLQGSEGTKVSIKKRSGKFLFRRRLLNKQKYCNFYSRGRHCLSLGKSPILFFNSCVVSFKKIPRSFRKQSCPPPGTKESVKRAQCSLAMLWGKSPKKFKFFSYFCSSFSSR